MKPVNELPPIGTRPANEKWKPLLDGQAYLLEAGDIGKNMNSTSSAIRVFAEKNGRRANIRMRPEGMYVQLTRKHVTP